MKRFAVIILVIAAATGLAYFYFRAKAPASPPAGGPPAKEAGPHRYGDPEKSISRVRIALVYAVPADKRSETAQWESLKPKLAQTLSNIAAFHKIQFRGGSQLDFEVYPHPIILNDPAVFYDDPAAPSPQALLTVSHELEERVFASSGDLYDPDFTARKTDGEYTVMGIVYPYGIFQGWGSPIYDSPLETPEEIARCLGIAPESVAVVSITSADGFFLISDSFWGDTAAVSGPSVLYHEFGHSLGLPDGYISDSFQIDQVDVSCKSSTEAKHITGTMTNDIMGLRRFDPLRINYLDASLLQEMGVR